jgi:drug/metabolite transporter (DMT)-like permease
MTGNLKQAIFHMAVAAFFFSLMALCVKLVPRLPVVQVVFVRSLLSLIFSYLLVRRRGLSPWGRNRRLLMLRGVFGTAGLYAYFSTLYSLPLATATVIQYLSPIFTAMIGAVALGERVGLARWACFAISFSGVALLKGFERDVAWPVLALGVAGSLASACAYNCIARLRHSEDSQVIMLYFPLLTTPLMLPWVVREWVSPSAQEWWMLLLIGLTVQAAQYCMTLSYQQGRPAAVSIVSYLGVLFALLWDVTVLQNRPSGAALLALGLVVAGVVASSLLDLLTPRSRATAASSSGDSRPAGP